MTASRSAFLVGLCTWLLATAGGVGGQVSPLLPDTESFYRETRENLERSQRNQIRYSYTERRTALHTNPFGRLGTGVMETYTVTPSQDGAVLHRRLIERDGVEVSDGRVERVEIERERQRGGRARRSPWDDTVAALEFQIDRREQLDGHSTIVVLFKPRENARPDTRQGRLARNFTGSIWVDEAAREIRRVEATAVDNISIGWGLVARLRKGAMVTLTREPIDAEVWLPTSLRFMGDGRAMLFRRLQLDHVVEWFDYRRADLASRDESPDGGR